MDNWPYLLPLNIPISESGLIVRMEISEGDTKILYAMN